MKLKCKICNRLIEGLSVIKKYTVEDDFEFSRRGYYRMPCDRDYIEATVEQIKYSCDCGENIITKDEVPKIIEFIRDGLTINNIDLRTLEYKNLVVVNKYVFFENERDI